jgi:DcmR-like sensory protein
MGIVSNVLHTPGHCDHLIQAYTNDGFLGAKVAEYVAAGFERGEAAVLLATPEHTTLFSERLAAGGLDVAAALRTRQLLFLDAGQTLLRFMIDGRPDRERFLSIVATTLDQVRAAGHRRIRLYGEMVDLLWPDSLQATVELERLWNEVLADERLSLICAYRLDALDRGVQGVLRQVTHCHSHLLPAENPEAFDAAVDRAYTEVFGVDGDVRTLRELLVAHERPTTRMPAAQAAMFALESLLPKLAHDVRTKAREYYRASPRRSA